MYSICCCSVAQSYPTLWDPMDCSMPGFPVLHYLLEFAQTHVCWVSDAIQPSHPLLPLSLPAFNLSQHQGLFQWVSSLHQVGCWSFSFSISPSNEYSGLTLEMTDWPCYPRDTCLLQHHNSKASVLRCSAFFMVQFSHPCLTPGKIIALTIQTFVGKMMSLLFNTLCRFVVACLLRSKSLISWLQSLSSVILKPRK